MGQKKEVGYKRLSLFDLAASRVANTSNVAEVKKGDLVEIIAPFSVKENYLGIVISFDETHMRVYHSDIRKTILWNRCVNCIVSSV